ncbi:hypothetical protein B0T24DRAFT_589379 [Lasiosphaeria ovina]|uniref:Uncharacterized protein n=1 Tax=Lasiosphaeria ovina TaxID=92902 RepID=A0AAE0KMC7_9PEZI|nr:hypothetical protein B0T24DRAFT_589379 [Lasiosphaeria ovina]
MRGPITKVPTGKIASRTTWEAVTDTRNTWVGKHRMSQHGLEALGHSSVPYRYRLCLFAVLRGHKQPDPAGSIVCCVCDNASQLACVCHEHGGMLADGEKRRRRELFSRKCGVITEEIDSGRKRIKMYTGRPSTNCRVTVPVLSWGRSQKRRPLSGPAATQTGSASTTAIQDPAGLSPTCGGGSDPPDSATDWPGLFGRYNPNRLGFNNSNSGFRLLDKDLDFGTTEQARL